MASKPSPNSSTSEGEVMDQRKRKRMESNRESARRSRMKKQQRLDELLNQAAQLKNDNAQISMQINLVSQQYIGRDSENTVLRTQVMELTDRLQSLNSVLQFVGDFSGIAVDIAEIPDPLLRPWQLPCPGQPIMASADMFQC